MYTGLDYNCAVLDVLKSCVNARCMYTCLNNKRIMHFRCQTGHMRLATASHVPQLVNTRTTLQPRLCCLNTSQNGPTCDARHTRWSKSRVAELTLRARIRYRRIFACIPGWRRPEERKKAVSCDVRCGMCAAVTCLRNVGTSSATHASACLLLYL